jgi:hypothetical protein
MSMLSSATWLQRHGMLPRTGLHRGDGCESLLVGMKVWRARPETWRLGEKVAHKALVLQARTTIDLYHTHPQTYKPLSKHRKYRKHCK